MKTVFSFAAFAVFQTTFLFGQTNSAMKSDRSKVGIDTIPPTQNICIDARVLSCNETVVINGICVTRHINGCCIQVGADGLMPGHIIIIDDIVYKDKNGKARNLPPIKFVIR